MYCSADGSHWLHLYYTYMKIWIRCLSLLLPLVLIATPLHAATPKAGGTCAKAGATAVYSERKFTCVKSGKKLLWNKGVQISVSKPVASITPKSTPAGYTMQQVATNNRTANCWTVINGWVYDLTRLINTHPGGTGSITSMCGIDSTGAFNAKHLNNASVAKQLLTFRLGPLKK